MQIEVLRVGHRPQRDKRITTHVALTARALGASRVHLAEDDPEVVASVRDVAHRFGHRAGEGFEMLGGTGWKGPIKAWKAAGGAVLHLTMYGRPLDEAVAALRASGRNVLVVVGAQKVPGDLYDLADENAAVGNQPHSEVAALALAIDRLRGGAWAADAFVDAHIEVLPNPRGKTVVERGRRGGTGANTPSNDE